MPASLQWLIAAVGVANALIAGPVVAAAAVTTLLSLPAPAFVSLLYPMTSGFVTFAAYGRFRRSEEPLPAGISHSASALKSQLVVLAILGGISLALLRGLPSRSI